jgi:hypothetical protein
VNEFKTYNNSRLWLLLNGVSADYLLSDKQVQIKDTELMQMFEVVQQLQGDAKRLVNNFLDMVIRDFKTKQAYSQ